MSRGAATCTKVESMKCQVVVNGLDGNDGS